MDWEIVSPENGIFVIGDDVTDTHYTWNRIWNSSVFRHAKNAFWCHKSSVLDIYHN